jgi:hypothetical protein
MDIKRIGLGKPHFPSINENQITDPEFDFTFDSTLVIFSSTANTFDFDLQIKGPGDYSKIDYNQIDYKTE